MYFMPVVLWSPSAELVYFRRHHKIYQQQLGSGHLSCVSDVIITNFVVDAFVWGLRVYFRSYAGAARQ